MKTRMLFYPLLALALLTAMSCSNPTSSSPTTVTLTPTGPYPLYVVNYDSEYLTAYRNGTDGALSALSPSAYDTGKAPYKIAISPNGKYLYVTNSTSTGSNGLSAYSIGSGGALTDITNGTFATGTNPHGVAVSPDSKYLYVANYGSSGSDGLSAYSIGSDGSLTALSTATTDSKPNGIAISPDGKYLYVTMSSSTGSYGLWAFTIQSDGTLSYKSSYSTGIQPNDIAINTNGNYLYVTNAGGNNLSAYSISSSGALSLLSTSSYATGAGPRGIAISHDGRFLYVANYSWGSTGLPVSAYRIASNGILTEIATSVNSYLSGTKPIAIAISPDSCFVYVTNAASSTGENGILVYSIGSTGSLTSIGSGTFTTGYSPQGIAIGPKMP